jgi:V8-like Glu-specific endopeptidase
MRLNDIRWLPLSLTLALLVSPAFGYNIFGKKDPRVLFSPKKFPAIGKLVFPGVSEETGEVTEGSCTGTLIAADVVLTAGHCAKDVVKQNLEAQEENEQIEAHNAQVRAYNQRAGEQVYEEEELVDQWHEHFLPAFSNGQLPPGAEAILDSADAIGDILGDYSMPQDWAILKLEHKPTSQVIPDFGKMEISTDLKEGMRLISIGYSGDFADGNSASLAKGCHVKKVNEDHTFLHDCSYNNGASGGPMLSVSVNGVVLTEANEKPLLASLTKDSKIDYKIVGINIVQIPALEEKVIPLHSRDPFSDFFGGRFGFSQPHRVAIVDEPVMTFDEYSEDHPNIGNGAANFIDEAKKVIAGKFDSLKPGTEEPSPKTSSRGPQSWVSGTTH